MQINPSRWHAAIQAKIKNPDAVVYLWLLLLCFLCYGLFIPLLGFYWDDIPYLYLFNLYGPMGYPAYVSSDRPFSAWIFMLTTALFGNQPFGYHLLALILRYLSAVLFYQVSGLLTTDHKHFTIMAASIFLVYPGFLQQPIALIYNHHLSVLCLFLLSVWLMLKNIQREKPNHLLLLISLLASLHMFSIENFATLELIRPVLIFIILQRKGDRQGMIRKTLRLWLPYLAVFFIFIIWRVFIFKFPTYQPGLIEHFRDNPLSAFTALLGRIPADLSTSTIGAWANSLRIPTVSSFGRGATLLFWLLCGGTFLLSLLFCRVFLPHAAASKTDSRFLSGGLIVGSVLFLLAGAIVWVLDLPLEIVFAWDRMTLAFIPATAIFFSIILSLLSRPTIARGVLFGLLISAAVGSHFQNGMAYKRDGENFQDFLWQLSWRLPALEPNTTLLGSEIGLRFYSDNSLTPALNLMYRSDDASPQLDYLFYYTEVRLGSGLPALQSGLPISQSHRNFYFNGSTSDIVALKYDPPACVQVMDRVFSNSITNPNLSDRQVAELRISNLNRIRLNPVHTPPEFLAGTSPPLSWCYYFQKADLARQFGQYAEIVRLGDEAIADGLAPRVGSEWLPFLEGYIRTGRWDQAQDIADQVFHSEGNFESGLCYTLGRIRAEVDEPDQPKITDLLRVYNCL